MDSMRSKAQKMMPHIMALNKNPTMGMKNNRQPKPGVSNLTAYAQGGSVKKYPSKDFGDFGRLPSDKMDFVKGRTPSKVFDTDAYMSGKTAGMNRQSKAKEDSALNAYANRGRDYIKDKLDDADVAISKRIGLTERAKNKESFRMGLKEEGYAKGGKVMAKGGAADKKQDKSMLSRHNKLMHPGQKSKLMHGGMVKGYEKGGGLVTRGDKANIKARAAEYAKKTAEMLKEANKPLSKVKGFLTDNVEKMKEAVKSVGRPDYRDSPLKKTVQSAANLGKGTLKLGRLVTPAGAFLTTMSPSSLNEGEDDRMRKINKDFSEKPESLRDYKGPSTDIKINMPKLPSIPGMQTAKKMSPFEKAFDAARKEKGAGKTFTFNDEKFSTNIKEEGYKKGGMVKAKGDKKKVMGTVGEAKALMNAMKKVRRPATPMPGARMAGLGMAPPMAPPMMTPPMKHGGKVMKKAANGAAKLRKKSPMPNKIKMMFYKKGV